MISENMHILFLFQDVEIKEVVDDIHVVEVDVKEEGEEDHVKMEKERWSEVRDYYSRLPICTYGRDEDEWQFQQRKLNFQYIPHPHNGVCLTKTISSLLTDQGIFKRMFTITIDNSSSNDIFVNLLKGQLGNEGALRSNRDYFHVLNLVVKDGLKAIEEGIVKVREFESKKGFR